MPASTSIQPYSLAARTGLAEVWWKTGRVAVKAGGLETGGRVAQVEIDDPRATAPPMHHQEDETFCVIAGEVTIFAGRGRAARARGVRAAARALRLRDRRPAAGALTGTHPHDPAATVTGRASARVAAPTAAGVSARPSSAIITSPKNHGMYR